MKAYFVMIIFGASVLAYNIDSALPVTNGLVQVDQMSSLIQNLENLR